LKKKLVEASGSAKLMFLWDDFHEFGGSFGGKFLNHNLQHENPMKTGDMTVVKSKLAE